MGDGAMLRLLANLSAKEIAREAPEATGKVIWGGESEKMLAPRSVFWRIA